MRRVQNDIRPLLLQFDDHIWTTLCKHYPHLYTIYRKTSIIRQLISNRTILRIYEIN